MNRLQHEYHELFQPYVVDLVSTLVSSKVSSSFMWLGRQASGTVSFLVVNSKGWRGRL